MRGVTTMHAFCRLAGLALVLSGFAMSGCTGQALCEKRKECNSNPPAEDFVRICATEYDGAIRGLRANKEDECHALANAQLAYDACRVQLDCDDFNDAEHNGECDRELDAYLDAWDDADGVLGECSVFD